jgi:hypothetical protein
MARDDRTIGDVSHPIGIASEVDVGGKTLGTSDSGSEISAPFGSKDPLLDKGAQE